MSRSSTSEAFRVTYTDKTGVHVWVGWGWVGVLGWTGATYTVILGPGNLRSWLGFERIGRCAAIPDPQLETVSTTRRNGQGPDLTVYLFVLCTM